MAVIAFTGGGTGGHIYPGLAVIEAIRKQSPETRIFWIGSGKEQERRAVEQAGIPYYAIASGKLRRSFALKNFTDIFNIIKGIFQAKKLLTELRADLLFSKGGYVSVPPCIAAKQLGIPVITHESDVSPGLATKINLRFADKLIASWDATLSFLKPQYKSKTIVLGNPVREAIAHGNAERGRAFLGLDHRAPLLLVLGGSQGAEQINKLIEAAAPVLIEKVCIAHQTGPGKSTCIPQGKRYIQFPYLEKELADVLAAADIIICRAGAGTLWECTLAGKPMILIPLCGGGTRGDQVDNTRLLVKEHAALGLIGNEAQSQNVIEAVQTLLEHPELRESLPERARNILRTDAAKTIVTLCLDLVIKEADHECT